MIRFLFLASLLVFALPATAVVSQSDIFGHTFAYRPDDGKSSEYDPAGNRIAHTAFTNQTTRYAYDLDGKRLLATDPNGTSTATTYTASGQIASQTDARGATRYQYDALDRLTRQDNPDGSRRRHFRLARRTTTAMHPVVLEAVFGV